MSLIDVKCSSNKDITVTEDAVFLLVNGINLCFFFLLFTVEQGLISSNLLSQW